MNIEEDVFEIDEEKCFNSHEKTTSLKLNNDNSTNTTSLFNQVTAIDISSFKSSFNPKNNYTFLSKSITNDIPAYMFSDDLYEPGLKMNCADNANCFIECDDSICKLNYSICNNRHIQKGIHWNSTIVVETINGMGKQLLCNLIQGIERNVIIGEFTGKIIRFHEMKHIRRISGHNILLMELYTNKDEKKNLYIDPTGIYGNNTFYINHSCSPNAEYEIWNIEGIRRVAIKTINQIRFREPITVDYNIIVQSSVNINQLMKCKCGSENCKDTVQHIRKEKKKKNNKK
jgi:hypothetical protein